MTSHIYELCLHVGCMLVSNVQIMLGICGEISFTQVTGNWLIRANGVIRCMRRFKMVGEIFTTDATLQVKGELSAQS